MGCLSFSPSTPSHICLHRYLIPKTPTRPDPHPSLFLVMWASKRQRPGNICQVNVPKTAFGPADLSALGKCYGWCLKHDSMPSLDIYDLLLGLPSGALHSSIYGPSVQPQTDEGIANGASAKSTCRQCRRRCDPWPWGQTQALLTQGGGQWT